jgi:hypothetical protein
LNHLKEKKKTRSIINHQGRDRKGLRDSQNKSKNRRKKKEEEQNLFDLVFI